MTEDGLSAPAEASDTPFRRAGLWVAGALGLHVVLAALLFEPTLFTGADAGHYMVLGESLRSGAGYRDLFLPGTPLHAKYPPGYPLLLAFLGWFGGLQLFKLASLSLTAASVWLVFRLGCGRATTGVALVGAALFGITPVLLQFSHLVLSESLFAFLVLLSLVLSQKSGRWWTPVLVAACAFLTRTAGLPLLLAFAIGAALDRRGRRTAWTLAVAVFVVAAWLAWQRIVAPGQLTYIRQFLLVNPYDPGSGSIGFSGIWLRVATNLWTYASGQLPASFGLPAPRSGGVPAGTALAGLLLASLAAAGWFRDVMRRVTPISLFTFLYLGLILLWPPVWSDRRFLLPVLPLLILYALEAVRALVGWRSRSASAGLVSVAAVALTAAVPAMAASVRLIPDRVACQLSYRRGFPCDLPQYASFYAMARWAEGNTPVGSIIATRSPATFYLYSRRRGDVYRYSRNPEVVLRGLEEMGADYVVVDNLSVTTVLYLVPTIEAFPARFELVHAMGEPPTLLFRLLRAQRTAARPSGEP